MSACLLEQGDNMCGFVGFMGGSTSNMRLDDDAILKRMADMITYRGPDDAGYWCDEDHHVGLGHRRLSIVDTSSAGHQPMVSVSSRFVLVFNGEIYNHRDIRDELTLNVPDFFWRGYSDTETLLAGFDNWGVTATLNRAIGMFAFALWDRVKKKLILGRDRFGEKPLYFGKHNGTFLFGSELKAIQAHPSFIKVIDRNSLTLLLRFAYIPAPFSIYKDIEKVLPGHIVEINQSGTVTSTAYWSVSSAYKKGKESAFFGTYEDAVGQLDTRLQEAIGRQMMADVPFGAFLSGGIDSSLIVAIMQRLSWVPVKTFSMGFEVNAYSEAPFAKKIAKHLGTEHTEHVVSSEEALAVISKLPEIYCEPFADSSQIPTYLVSKLAKKDVTVALSGDAGDEVFCGYNRYVLTNSLWGKVSRVPLPIRLLVSKFIMFLSVKSWNRFGDFFPIFNLALLGEKLHKAARVISAKCNQDLYIRLVSQFEVPNSIVIGAKEPDNVFLSKKYLDSHVENMMLFDTVSYLPDDILTKVDRAAMAVSLETRVPFLDHTLFEFVCSLPLDMKLRNGVSKSILRDVLYRYVPRELVERPKMGFGIPLDDWLRGPLKDWASNLLAPELLDEQGFFRSAPITKMWDEHMSGKRNWQNQLWIILMFQSWYQVNFKFDVG